MYKIIVMRLVLLLACLLILGGCSSTRLVTSWRDASFQGGQLRKPLVMAIVQKQIIRAKLEDEFVSQLRTMGVEAVQSYKFFPDQQGLDHDTIRARFPETGCDSVLVTRLVDVKKETAYVPGSTQVTSYGGPGYYDNFGSYYANSYTVVSTPGYTYDYKVYTLETNLYEARDEKLVWTAVTETEEPASVDAALKEFAVIVTGNMKKNNLF